MEENIKTHSSQENGYDKSEFQLFEKCHTEGVQQIEEGRQETGQNIWQEKQQLLHQMKWIVQYCGLQT